MRDYFDELIRQLAAYGIAIDEAFLHGLLSGCATIPLVDLDKLNLELSSGQPLADVVREATVDAVHELSAALSDESFRARFDPGQDAEARRWIEGYVKAVNLHEVRWEEQNELHLDAGANLIMLHALIDGTLQRDTDMSLPGPADLQEHPVMVTNLVLDIYQQFHDDADDDFDIYDGDDLDPLLHFSDEDLKEMSEEELFGLVVACDDELSLQVVHECAGRKAAMVPVLREHLEDAANWADNVDESDWWALLHAVHILGLIPGEAAAKVLLDAFQRINFDEHNNLADWLSSWPALCQNKRDYTTAPLKSIAENCKIRWYARWQAIDCVLADAEERGAAELEQAIDWLAALCGDHSEDDEFRVMAGHTLLDYPRERWRAVMQELVALQKPQSPFTNAYTRADIQHALDAGDNPEWHRFNNPWKFYDADEIRRRQERWLKEDGDADFDTYRHEPREPQHTYVREQAKIGRNDPCPCGSGRKYKKCCMNALH
ncbi:MAG: SEC-C domain-containing protein [Proteobacteria bacterium]|nr:SEC-C domain-containing protein [Pseudomonadota bacterium]